MYPPAHRPALATIQNRVLLLAEERSAAASASAAAASAALAARTAAINTQSRPPNRRHRSLAITHVVMIDTHQVLDRSKQAVDRPSDRAVGRTGGRADCGGRAGVSLPKRSPRLNVANLLQNLARRNPTVSICTANGRFFRSVAAPGRAVRAAATGGREICR